MLDVSILNEISPEANWNIQTGVQDHVLSQADALTKSLIKIGLETAEIVLILSFCGSWWVLRF